MGKIIFENGELKHGCIHSCSGEEFIDNFCKGENRKDYTSAVINIFDFAKKRNARRVFIGGSFLNLKKEPHDFDCVIVFKNESDIPDFIDTSVIGNIAFDILYASEDNRNIIDSYLDLFRTDKIGVTDRPIVEVILDDKITEWKINYEPDEDEKEIIKKMYINRTVLERHKARGVLLTIHGVNTKAFWNSKFGPLASSQGWIFAPFIYENPRRLLLSPNKREKVVDEFGEYFYSLKQKYNIDSASIVAHSFGTYIIAKYLYDRSKEDVPIQIDSIVLTGSIVSKDYDWTSFYPEKIGRILNLSSKNDKAVKLMPKYNWIKKYLMMEHDGIFGRIGYEGIIETDSVIFIKNKEVNMANHCNIFKDEILDGTIMPFLNANQDVCLREYYNKKG